MTPPDDERPGRTLLVALGAMLGVALLVGAAVGGVSLVALQGFVDDSRTVADAQDEESLFIPDYTPTESADDDPKIPGIKQPKKKPSAKPSEKAQPARKITLFAAPQQVRPGERINLNGVYRSGEGATLQIQRREGGSWTDFPVDTTVRGGSFETWIQTSRTGAQRFRVYDERAERGSNPVTVTVG